MKIFKISFLLMIVLGFGNLFTPNITLATAHDASVIISPITASVGQNSIFTYTVTNGSSSTANIGSVEIQLPTGFGTPSVNIVSTSSNKVWILGSSDGYVDGFNSSTGKIRIKATRSIDKLDADEFVTIQITTIAPNTSNLYEWTTFPLANLDFNGTLFTLTNSQPTVNVTDPVTPPVSTHLDIKTDVDVPASCNATDTDATVHNYPEGASYLAICALETAIEKGAITAKLSNQFPNLGLFITGINNVVADSSSQYWAIYQNGSFANSGIALLPILAGDIIMFQLHDFSDNNLGDQVTLNIHSLISPTPPPTGNTGGGNTVTPPATFDTTNALAYLKSAQANDGSFGGDSMYTDWVGIAFGAMSVIDDSRDKLLAYLNTHNSISALLTDNERRAMALLALGQNPYSFNGINYIKAITDSFDGAQFGDLHEDNDDIFALIPLTSAGYTASDEIITKDIAFIISVERTDGSWDGSVDMTAAAIQALKPFDSITSVAEALAKATAYMTSKQNVDGGFSANASSVYSTTWAMQAMNTLAVSWTKNGHTPMDFLASKQTTDGAVLPSSDTKENRIWATSYSIPAALGKPWSAIMQNVAKPATPNGQNTSSVGGSGPVSPPPVQGHVIPTANLTQSNSAVSAPVPQNISLNNNVEIVASKTDTVTEKKKSSISSKSKTNPEKSKITGDVLTASAVDALPKNNSSKTIPIALGATSGLGVLYLIRRFFIR